MRRHNTGQPSVALWIRLASCAIDKPAKRSSDNSAENMIEQVPLEVPHLAPQRHLAHTSDGVRALPRQGSDALPIKGFPPCRGSEAPIPQAPVPRPTPRPSATGSAPLLRDRM